jgi:spore coat polysaccharide biosynthesis protein SpsF (cytidylyltransferase family)|tara:strand:+ start:2728 stop:3471 length:744 start_codon:yes stop_codon:yes gene_type:complete
MNNKNFALMIQARANSKRLPNKILEKIDKKEVLVIMLKRLKKKFRNKIIVAIGNNNCEKIVNVCKKEKIKFFIGDNNNVLARFYKCAQKNKIKTIVRIPSDCPLIDPNIIKKGLKKFYSNNVDYVSNLLPPSYIDGNDVEIFSIKTLAKIYDKAKSRFDKEHVTTFLRRNKRLFKIMNFKTNKDLSLKYRLTIDFKEDLIVLKKILNNKSIFLNYKSIRNIFEKNPEISKINKKFIGTMWYQTKINS